MLGSILGLLSAAAFGVNSIFTRRGVLIASSSYIANLSIFTGPPFFLLTAIVIGDLFEIGKFSLRAYGFLALSGIVHFALGRTWGYRCVQLIGATRSNIMTNLNPIVTISLAMIVLRETTKPLMVLGALLSLSGPLIIILKEHAKAGGVQSKLNPPKHELDRRTLYKGVFYGVGAAIFWGSSSILIKLGLENGGSPIVGSLIAYLTASIIISPSSLIKKEKRKEMFKRDKKSLQLALLAGLTTNIAQLFRYLALAYGSAIVVSLMGRTSTLWTLVLSFIFNREYESFSRWVFLGNATLMAGTILVLIS